MPLSRPRIIASALSQARDVMRDALGIDNAEAFSRIEHFIQENSRHWRENDPAINYDDPFCRMAYLYRNVAVHATLVEKAIAQNEVVRQLIASRRNDHALRVCALGGGPGSELLGMVRYLDSTPANAGPVRLDFALIDKTKEWDDSWHALKEAIDEELYVQYGSNPSAWPVIVSRSFLPLDVTSAAEFAKFATRFAQLDIIFLSYVLSELLGRIEGVANVVGFLAKTLRRDGLIIVIDRNELAVRNAAQSMVESNVGLTLVSTVQERGAIEDSLKDFGEWYIEVEELPRRSWQAFVAVIRKT